MLAKQSTALTVVVGPILDSTGAEYALAVIGDLSISKNGGTLTAMASAATLTYIANGMYTLVTTTGNMDTLGAVQVTCNKATYQMPKMERNVVPASVYDAIIANATNTTGGLPAATGTISALAGAVSTLTAGGVRTELATELGRIDATIGSRATQTSVDTIYDFIDTEVAAIKAKTDLIVTFPTNFSSLDITVGGAIAELGANALTANSAVDAIPPAVWNALLASYTTANSFGARIVRSANSNNTVQITGGGSNHIFAVLHDAEPNSIPEDAFVDGALSARALAADAVGEIADGVWDEATSGHITAGTTGKALIDSGAAGNPWATDLATGYSGTEAGNILNQVKLKTDTITGNQTINVYPVSASTPERVAGTTLTFYRDESRSVSVVTDFTLTNLTLQFTVEDQDGNDVYTLANASITRSGQTFTVPVTTAVTGGLGQYRWSMRDITGGGNSVIAMGVLTVQEAASNG
jgi:hypothetical protein